VINTCSVTENATSSLSKWSRKEKLNNKAFVAVGCYAVKPEELAAVDGGFGSGSYREI
jgi:tRNA A37 methylthiotransferase MiaB